MEIIQAEDCPEDLAHRFADRLTYQSVFLYAFDVQKAPGDSIVTTTACLMDLVLETLRTATVSRPHSFSVFGLVWLIPWWTGQECMGFLIGGEMQHYEGSWTELLNDRLRAVPGYVECEGVRWQNEEYYLLAFYDQPADTLHISSRKDF